MLTSDQHNARVAITTCTGHQGYTGTASRMGVSQWDTTVNVPSTDVYYFVFENKNSHTVSISLTVSSLQTTQTTEMLAATSYLTASSTWPTQTLASNQQTAGLGPVFFLGTALLVIGVVLGFFYVRGSANTRKRSGGKLTSHAFTNWKNNGPEYSQFMLGPPVQVGTLKLSEAECTRRKEAFGIHWNSLSDVERQVVHAILDEFDTLQARA